MVASVTCKCGAQVQKKLFAGADVSLLTPEQFLDQDFSGVNTEKMALMLILASKLLLRCRQCGRYLIVEESADGDTVSFLVPEPDA